MKRRSFLAVLASIPAAIAFPVTSEAVQVRPGAWTKPSTLDLLMKYKFKGVEHALRLKTCTLSRGIELGVIDGRDDEPEMSVYQPSGSTTVDVAFPVTPEVWAELEAMMFDVEECMDFSFHMKGDVMSGKFFISCLSVDVPRNGGMFAKVSFISIGAITVAAA